MSWCQLLETDSAKGFDIGSGRFRPTAPRRRIVFEIASRLSYSAAWQRRRPRSQTLAGHKQPTQTTVKIPKDFI